MPVTYRSIQRTFPFIYIFTIILEIFSCNQIKIKFNKIQLLNELLERFDFRRKLSNHCLYDFWITILRDSAEWEKMFASDAIVPKQKLSLAFQFAITNGYFELLYFIWKRVTETQKEYIGRWRFFILVNFWILLWVVTANYIFNVFAKKFCQKKYLNKLDKLFFIIIIKITWSFAIAYCIEMLKKKLLKVNLAFNMINNTIILMESGIEWFSRLLLNLKRRCWVFPCRSKPVQKCGWYWRFTCTSIAKEFPGIFVQCDKPVEWV